jgi:hypothetical protein
MDEAAVLAASRREHELYGELVAVYRALADGLRDEGSALDPMWLTEQDARAEALATALAALAAALAPRRLTGAAVAPEARALWRASAALAAAALAANAEVAALAAARRGGLAAHLARLGAARRGLAGYRPIAAERAGLTDQRA